jgi:hypothetical protein
MSNLNQDGVSVEREAKREKILSIAAVESVKYAAMAFAAVGAATVIAAKTNAKFNRITSISAKASFPVMAGMGTFSIVYEKTVNEAQRFPERYGITGATVVENKRASMPIHHKFINYLYDHPFQLVAALGIPFAGMILKEQLPLKHLTLSQKIMHSRVLAQGGIIIILLSTMAFREYMDRHGRFPGDEDEQEEKH